MYASHQPEYSVELLYKLTNTNELRFFVITKQKRKSIPSRSRQAKINFDFGYSCGTAGLTLTPSHKRAKVSWPFQPRCVKCWIPVVVNGCCVFYFTKKAC